MTVTHLTDRVVWVHGAVGQITRATHAQALAMLAARGVTTVMYERRGRMKTIELAKASETEQLKAESDAHDLQLHQDDDDRSSNRHR